MKGMKGIKENNKPFIDQVADFYISTVDEAHPQGNMSAVANQFGITRAKVNKILITAGVIDSPLHRDIMELKEQGYETDDIAAVLGVSAATVRINIPYEKVIYNGEEKSAGAVYVEEYRKREKVFLNSVVRKKTDREIQREIYMSDPENQAMLNLMREQGLLDNQGMLDNIDIKDDPVHLEPFFTVEESKLFKMNPDIMLLHIELDDEIPEEDRALCGVEHGKSISRDILVHHALPLHNLHYVINQAFGFTNSHMHEFELSSEDLKWVTAGKVENWKKLVGLVFKNPLRDEDLDFWDDDYEGGSPKKWMRSKYTGPGYVKCYEEGYRNVIQELGNWKVRAKSLEELLHKYESNPFSVNEVLSIYNILELDPSYPRSFDEFYEVLAENIQDAATYSDESTLSQPWVRGFAKELHYTYDFGDSWQFTITPKYDAEYLVKAGRVTEKGIREAIQRVCVLARPVILAADGYPLIDDCGGIDGYVETLRAIEDGDKDSKAWTEGMGWKKKIDKGVL